MLDRGHKRRQILARTKLLVQQKRDGDALALWLGGATLAQIAGQLGWADAMGAKRGVDRARHRLIAEPVERARKDDLERCRRLLLALMPRALGGHLETVDRVLHVLARRAKLLGLDVQTEKETFSNALAIQQSNTQVNVLIQIGAEQILVEDWRRKAIEAHTDGDGNSAHS